MRCCVQNCTNDTKKTTKSHGITFHMFPKEPNLRDAWLEALGMLGWEPKDRSSICSEHFRNNDFYETKCGRRKVKSGAVPVVELDSAEELNAPATQRVCRVCLAMDTKLYDFKEYSLDTSYSLLTGLDTNDMLPTRLCWECSQRLRASVAFRDKAMRCHGLLVQMLLDRSYLTIRDIKSVNRIHNKLNSTLTQHIYEPNDFDLEFTDGVLVKSEEIEQLDEKVEEPEMMQVDLCSEIKDESNGFTQNEIFFHEYTDFQNGKENPHPYPQDSDDDKTLSEVVKVKPKREVKKKKLKIPRKSKPVSIKITNEKKCEDENPGTTIDKFKTAYVKRRGPADGLDESLFTITTLTYEEQIQEVQRRQESHSYLHAPYQCTICYRGFLNKTRYEVHAVRHSEKVGEYECFICKTRLKTSRALRKHLTAQHTEKFSCNGCPFSTRSRGVAREHQKWHAGTKYQCPHCPSEFDKLTTYMGHIRIKHVSDCVCELCGFTFVSKKGIEVHKKRKHRLEDGASLEGPYCEVCDVKFVSDEAHARHLKLSSRHSSDSDPNRIRNDSQSINSCDKNGHGVRKFERRPLVHGRGAGDRREPLGPITCEQCGVQLRNLRLYAQHFRRAHPDKNRTKYPAMKTPCMCEQCGRIFQSMALLKDHMWVHTGEKRFKCDRCPKSFTQKTNLVFHLRVHSSQRPSYECPLCGKQFAFYNNRQRHMFIHTGLKPFKCETCGKCFTTSGEERAHVEHVHMKKPWPKRMRARRDHHWDKTPEHNEH